MTIRTTTGLLVLFMAMSSNSSAQVAFGSAASSARAGPSSQSRSTRGTCLGPGGSRATGPLALPQRRLTSECSWKLSGGLCHLCRVDWKDPGGGTAGDRRNSLGLVWNHGFGDADDLGVPGPRTRTLSPTGCLGDSAVARDAVGRSRRARH